MVGGGRRQDVVIFANFNACTPVFPRRRVACPMPSAITVRQPFATPLVRGVKPWELRSTRLRIPTGGRWLWVHAGGAVHPDRELAPPEWRGAVGLPMSAIVGAIRIDRMIPVPEVWGSPWCPRLERLRDWWAWEVGAVVETPPSLRVAGALGIWTPPPALGLTETPQ